MSVLKVENLTKRFGDVVALENVSFSVKAGELLAFLGPNGSGKTTTLNIIAGLLDADAGEVELLGKQPGDRDYFDGVSFLSGDSQHGWGVSGRNILRFYASLARVPMTRIDELSVRFGIADKLERRWTAYSNGEKARIRLVRALLTKPKVLFLDEPTVGLDPDLAEFVRRELARLNREGTTILLTTHYMREVEELADRVCFIHNGRIIKTGTLDEFHGPRAEIVIEYAEAPHGAERLGTISGRELTTSLDRVEEALRLGTVVSIRTEREDLESYFIEVARR